MSNTEVQIPDGMMAAVDEAIGKARYENPNLLNADGELRPTLFKFVILGAALRWLSENPVLPTAEQLYSTIGKLPVAMCDIVWTERDRAMIAEWQRRMFRAPEPEVSEVIKDLLTVPSEAEKGVTWTNDGHDRAVFEAYRRGQKAGAQ